MYLVSHALCNSHRDLQKHTNKMCSKNCKSQPVFFCKLHTSNWKSYWQINKELLLENYSNVYKQYKANNKDGTEIKWKINPISDELNTILEQSVYIYHQLYVGRRWITVMFRLLERERKTNMHLGRLYDSPWMPWSLECQQGSIIFINATSSLGWQQLCLLCLCMLYTWHYQAHVVNLFI